MFSPESALKRYADLDQSEIAELEAIRMQNAELATELPFLTSRREFLSDRRQLATPRPSLAAFARLMTHARTFKRELVNDPRFSGLVHQVLGVANLATDEQPHQGQPFSRTVRSCSAAEYYFCETVEQVRANVKEDDSVNTEQKSITVFHDSTGKPLAIRKAHEEVTALSLVPIAIGDVTLPAGTIINVERPADMDATGKRVFAVPYGEHRVYRSFKVDAIGVTPARISPWAYEQPDDRAIFACHQDIYDQAEILPARANLISSYSLGDFTQAACDVLSMCGVSAPVASDIS